MVQSPEFQQGTDSPTHLLVIPSRTQVQPTTSTLEAKYGYILAFTSKPYGGLLTGETWDYKNYSTVTHVTKRQEKKTKLIKNYTAGCFPVIKTASSLLLSAPALVNESASCCFDVTCLTSVTIPSCIFSFNNSTFKRNA